MTAEQIQNLVAKHKDLYEQIGKSIAEGAQKQDKPKAELDLEDIRKRYESSEELYKVAHEHFLDYAYNSSNLRKFAGKDEFQGGQRFIAKSLGFDYDTMPKMPVSKLAYVSDEQHRKDAGKCQNALDTYLDAAIELAAVGYAKQYERHYAWIFEERTS